jgi:hypothetical protein
VITTTLDPVSSSVTTAAPSAVEVPASNPELAPGTTAPGSTPTTTRVVPVVPGQAPTTPTTAVPFPNFAGTAFSPSTESVCPVAFVGSLCDADPGVYAYVLTATDSLGRSVFSKTVLVTVTPRL